MLQKGVFRQKDGENLSNRSIMGLRVQRLYNVVLNAAFIVTSTNGSNPVMVTDIKCFDARLYVSYILWNEEDAKTVQLESEGALRSVVLCVYEHTLTGRHAPESARASRNARGGVFVRTNEREWERLHLNKPKLKAWGKSIEEIAIFRDEWLLHFAMICRIQLLVFIGD